MRGAFRRPPKVVQGVLDLNSEVLANSASPSSFLYLLHLKACDPSFFLSPASRAFRKAGPRWLDSDQYAPLVDNFLRFLSPLKCYSKVASKKMRKSKFLASQNELKINAF